MLIEKDIFDRMPKKVLILCHDFPPHNSVAAQRPYSWYRYFKSFGYSTTVITKTWKPNASNPVEALRAEYNGESSIETTGFGKIIRVSSNQILPEKMLLKYGDKKFSLLRKLFTFIYKALSFFIPFFDRNQTIYTAAVKECFNENFDFVISTGEPFILFVFANKLRKKFGIKWIGDYRDMWKNNHNARFRNDLLSRLLNWWEWQIEKRVVPHATFVTTTEPMNAQTLKKRIPNQIEIIYNGFEDFYQSYTENQKSTQLILTHTGTIIPGQEFEFLLQAISELNTDKKITPADLQIRFIGIEFYGDQMQRLFSYDKTLAPYFFTTPRLSRTQALEWNSKSDFLISLTDPGYKTISVKTYDYLSVKKPILVIPDDRGLLSEIVEQTQSGFSFDSVEKLKTFLLEKIELKKNNQPLTTLSFNAEKISFYRRENQAKIFVALLNNAQSKN